MIRLIVCMDFKTNDPEQAYRWLQQGMKRFTVPEEAEFGWETSDEWYMSDANGDLVDTADPHVLNEAICKVLDEEADRRRVDEARYPIRIPAVRMLDRYSGDICCELIEDARSEDGRQWWSGTTCYARLGTEDASEIGPNWKRAIFVIGDERVSFVGQEHGSNAETNEEEK